MEVNALKCLMCGDIIYSRARHDFRYCTCGNIYIDGGFDYCKIGFIYKDKHESKKINIDINNKGELFNDWNKHQDKYGLIKDPKYTKENLIVAKAKVLLRSQSCQKKIDI